MGRLELATTPLKIFAKKMELAKRYPVLQELVSVLPARIDAFEYLGWCVAVSKLISLRETGREYKNILGG
jgi:hypothetical protein